MSYLVCHVQKFKASDVKGMQKHNQRESENSKNKDIDRSKTELNYDLHNEDHINYNHKVKGIIQDGFKGDRAMRKDAVVMTGTLITSDGEFFKRLSPEEQKEFFKQSYEYLKDRYGEKNIISAAVHMDETTPHMHLCSVPLTEQGKLSAKTLFDRKSLLQLQKGLPAYLKSKGFDIERGESSNKKHIEINEFKKKTLVNKSKELDNKISELEQKEKQVKSIEKVLDDTKNMLKNDLEPLQGIKSNLNDLEHIKVKKNLIWGNLSISEDDYNKLLGLSKRQIVDSREIDKLKRENNWLKEDKDSFRQVNNNNEDKISELRKENLKLKKGVESLRQQGKAMLDTLETHNLIPEAQKRLADMRESEKVTEKALKKTPVRDWGIER